MPIKGARYRVTTKNGQKIRLAFRGKKVVEAKNLKTGATHTPAEFKADRARKPKRNQKRRTRKQTPRKEAQRKKRAKK